MLELEKLQKQYISKILDEKDIIICTIEEMSELTKVLTKYLRNSSKFSRENLQEELAHTLLMCEIITTIFDIKEDDIITYKIFALKKALQIES